MTNKRKDFNDSEIMDALDAESYNITKAAGRLGVRPNTLYKWVKESENLTTYISFRTESDAVRARDKLDEILSSADTLDPRQMGHIISICKILLDKQEADKNHLEVDQTNTHTIDKDLEDKIKKLLEE
jgi:hypothetical protein